MTVSRVSICRLHKYLVVITGKWDTKKLLSIDIDIITMNELIDELIQEL